KRAAGSSSLRACGRPTAGGARTWGVRMHQGRMNRARDALAEADHAAGSAGDRLLLMLESASVIIYCDFAIGEALQAADRAKPNAAGAAIDPNRAPVRTRSRAAQL